jgi:hypothetical protein
MQPNQESQYLLLPMDQGQKQIMLEIDKLPFKDTSAISASVKPCWVLWINCYGGDVIYGQAIVGFDPARASIITSEYSIHCTDINH